MFSSYLLGGGGGAGVKLIQRGTITLTGVTTNTATITAVVLANTRLKYLGHVATDGGTTRPIGSLQIELTNTTTITATVGLAGSHVVSFEVVEHYPGVIKSVQRGLVTPGTPVTISAVDTTKTECDFLGYVTSGTTNTEDRARFVLTDSTTVTAASGATLSPISFQVVEWY